MATTSDIAALTAIMQRIAPVQLAEDWDNVGLLVGSTGDLARRVLLCIDLTEAVLDEAVRKKIDAIVAYHPPIFSPRKTITNADAGGRILLRAIASGIAIHSPHTAADAAPNGVNDWLADGVGDGERRALIPAEELPASEKIKIITYGPRESVDPIRQGLAAIGAGIIGEYEFCSIEL
ncbi:MAG: Nif3-like dinuclear metal center hexameric protein, partial [Planctomycetota bacterium]|nr:Nif3-like dinuclear metal center hexameric protein [Planctomycetota bacterium]